MHDGHGLFKSAKSINGCPAIMRVVLVLIVYLLLPVGIMSLEVWLEHFEKNVLHDQFISGLSKCYSCI